MTRKPDKTTLPMFSSTTDPPTSTPTTTSRSDTKPPGVGLSRKNDPDTSRQAANDAAWSNSDSKTAAIVLGVMADGVPRIDAEIYDRYIEMTSDPKPLSDSRIRHGRKHAAELKLIAETGLRRRGPDGGMCREWVICQQGSTA